MQKKTEPTADGKKKPVSKTKSVAKEFSKLLETADPTQVLASGEAAHITAKAEASFWGKSRFDAPIVKASKFQWLKTKTAELSQPTKFMGAGLLAFSIGLSGYAWFRPALPNIPATLGELEVERKSDPAAQSMLPSVSQSKDSQQEKGVAPMPIAIKAPVAPQKSELSSHHKLVKESKQKKAISKKNAAHKLNKNKTTLAKDKNKANKKAKKILASKGMD